MKRSPVLAALLFAAVPVLPACVITLGGSSCSLSTVHGSGVEATQVREVAEFRSVHVSGGAALSVRVGEPQSLSVTCDDNLIDLVETEVRDGTLHIGMRRGSYSFYRPLEIRATVATLEGLSISGSCEADLVGLAGERFDLSVSGSGDVVASGRVDRLSAAVSGSGNLDLFGLQAREARVTISGSGDVEVQASESLETHVSGSGDVRYRGDPQRVQSHVSGSGSVTRG